MFLKITAICCIIFGSKAGNTERWLLEFLSAGEYLQYLEQKFTFTLVLSLVTSFEILM